MSSWLIGFVGVIYLATAAFFVAEGKPGMALTFIGYSIANVGLIWGSA
jgi:hypothetical protein